MTNKAPFPPLVVFDLDGTLVNSAPDLLATLNVILEGEGQHPLPFADAMPLLGGGARVLIRRGLLAGGVQVSDARLNELFDAFIAHYQAHIVDESHLYPGVEAALDRLEAEGWRFAVCTNKLESLAIDLLRKLGVAQQFETICGQDTFGIAKPHGTVLLQTIAKARGDAKRAIMIGDSRTDIDTARNAGIPVVAVDFGYTDQPIGNYNPDRVISHFDALRDTIADLIPSP